MDALKQDYYTTDYIFSLPEGERMELIDGILYDMASPTLTHQRFVSKFITEIRNYISENRGDCEVFPAPFGVFLFSDDKTYVEPDITVVCDPEKLSEKGCMGAPDWVIEIVSESSKNMDYLVKMVRYQKAGVREYWIVDPEKEMTTVYNFEKEFMEQYAFGAEVPAGIYEDFKIFV